MTFGSVRKRSEAFGSVRVRVMRCGRFGGYRVSRPARKVRRPRSDDRHRGVRRVCAIGASAACLTEDAGPVGVVYAPRRRGGERSSSADGGGGPALSHGRGVRLGLVLGTPLVVVGVRGRPVLCRPRPPSRRGACRRSTPDRPSCSRAVPRSASRISRRSRSWRPSPRPRTPPTPRTQPCRIPPS